MVETLFFPDQFVLNGKAWSALEDDIRTFLMAS
jgi:hypothetical protein